MLARLSRIARWAVVASSIVAATLIGATSSGAVTEPETSIYNYDIWYDNADFWFRSDVADATFQCRLNDEPFAPCVSPVNYRGLPEGTHRFEVRAVDAAGTVDSFPANLTFTSSPQPPPPPPAPPNDNWYGAEGISGTSGSVQGTNVNATRQWDEPFNPDGAERTVWYTWTAGRNSTIAFSAAGDGFTPRISIYSGSAAERAFLLSSGAGSASVTTHVGVEYHISVDGVAGGSGPFTLSWAYEQVGPPNDYFAEAQELVGENGSLTASTVGATTEANEPPHDGSAGENTGHSIWYRWTAPAAGTAIFTTEGSSFDTQLAAYTGTAVDSLIIRGWYEPDLNPWTKWSRLELQVEPGHVYSIVVDGQDAASGDVQLNWRMALDTGDTEAPTVEMWSPQPGANVDGAVTFMADAYDNEAVDRVMYFIEPNGHSGSPWLVGEAREWPYAVELDSNLLEPGLYSVHARAVDSSGNSTSYGFDITVGTVAPPTLIVPDSFTLEATRRTGALVRFSVRATDYLGDPLGFTCTPRSGGIFPLGVTTVTCTTAADSHGNRTARSFTVTVVDTTAPALTTPSGLVANAVSPSGAVLEFATTATDIVDGSITATCTPPSGATFAVGDTSVTCRATDASGNTGTASFTIHVKGADEQLGDLRAQIDSLVLEIKLAERLVMYISDVRKHLAEGRTNAVCGGVADMTAAVEKESGRGLTPEQAARLVSDAGRIRAVVGC